jgi:hypothetical protein
VVGSGSETELKGLQDAQKHAFAICSASHKHEETLFIRSSGKEVACYSLKKKRQLLVSIGDLSGANFELVPKVCIRGRRRYRRRHPTRRPHYFR